MSHPIFMVTEKTRETCPHQIGAPHHRRPAADLTCRKSKVKKLAGLYDDLDAHADVSDVLDEDATARKLAATREALGKQRAANEALKSELSAATEVRARASSMIAKRAIDSASLFSQREAQLERENEILQDNTRALFNEAKARQARAASARRGAHVSALPSARRVRCRRR